MVFILLAMLLPQDNRPAIPSDPEIKKAEIAVRQALSRDYAAATSRTARRDLARKLVVQSEGAKEVAERYVLLRDAVEHASGAGDFPGAFRTADLIAKTFMAGSDELKVSILTKTRKALTPEDAVLLTDTCMSEWEGRMAAKDYDGARKWAKEAEQVAKSARDPALIKAAGDMWNEAFDAKKAMEKASASPPGDPESNLSNGIYLAFFRDDWGKGLPLLASASNSALQEVAKKEATAVTGDPEIQADLSLAWGSLADREKDSGWKRRYALRARYWREQALKGAPGLARTKAIKKLLSAIVVQKAGYGPKDDLSKLIQDAIDTRPGAPVVVDGYLAQDGKTTGGPTLTVEYTADGQKRRDVANAGSALFLPAIPSSGSYLAGASLRFDILAVYYGSGATMIDCTENARRAYKYPLSSLSGAIAGADTTPFRTKTLVIVADLHGRRIVRVLREGETSQTLIR